MPHQRTSLFAIFGLLCLFGCGDSGMIDTLQNQVPGELHGWQDHKP